MKESEAHLEAMVLRELGRDGSLLLAKNEVSVSYRAACIPALTAALAPFGREAIAAALAAMKRHYIKTGMGVGSPDLVGAASGRFIGLELKTATGVVSDVQAAWHRAARARGAAVFVVRSVGEAVEAVARARRGEVE